MANGEAGRPAREFTDEQVEEIKRLARKGCKTLTIASITEIPETTLRSHFSGLIKKQHALKKEDVLDAQNRLLSEDNPTMAIWLGKQYLDQTDKQVVEQNTNLKLYGKEANDEDV